MSIAEMTLTDSDLREVAIVVCAGKQLEQMLFDGLGGPEAFEEGRRPNFESLIELYRDSFQSMWPYHRLNDIRHIKNRITHDVGYNCVRFCHASNRIKSLSAFEKAVEDVHREIEKVIEQKRVEEEQLDQEYEPFQSESYLDEHDYSETTEVESVTTAKSSGGCLSVFLFASFIAAVVIAFAFLQLSAALSKEGAVKKEEPTVGIYDLLPSSFIWTDRLLATSSLYQYCKSPRRAANAKLTRLERAGELRSGKVFAIHPQREAELLHVYRLGDDEPPAGKLAWLAESYYQQAAEQITVWWPSNAFSKRYGKWAGSDTLTKEHITKVNHSLICSATALALFKKDVGQAFRFKSEKRIEYDCQRSGHSGSVPDGLIENRHTTVAIESLGFYPKAFIEKKIRSLAQQYSRVEVWGVRA